MRHFDAHISLFTKSYEHMAITPKHPTVWWSVGSRYNNNEVYMLYEWLFAIQSFFYAFSLILKVFSAIILLKRGKSG